MVANTSDTRERLVIAARDLFMAQGYHATGISQILKTANANAGSLYYFFPTKEDLLLAVLEWYRDHIQDDLIDLHTSRISDPIEKVFALLDGYRQMLNMFGFELGCPIGNLALELANSHPVVRDLLVVNFEQWLNSVQGFLIDAQGRFPEGTDTKLLAIHVLTSMEGGVMLARTYRSLDYFDQTVESLRRYFDALLQRGSDWSAPRQVSGTT